MSASRWQAAEEMELEVEAVQSAWCRCPRWPGSAEGRSGMFGCPEVVWFGCESVVRGSRSRERDLSLPLNRWRSGGMLVGDGVAGLRCEVGPERRLVCCGGMSRVGSMR